MRTVEEELPEMPGQEAFLDVLTNMVGIIILLVVVIGLRASRAAVRAVVEQQPVPVVAEEVSSRDKLLEVRRATLNAEHDLESLIRQVADLRGETSLREQERDYLTTYVAAFEQELSERRSTLTADQQRDFDLRRRLAESQLTLENLTREQVALLSQPTEVESIENQPTPLARRSTGDEVILHLSEGHVAVIPRELIEAALQDVKANIWRLRESNRFASTVGPIGGFRMRYVVGMVPANLPGAVGSNFPGAPYQLPAAMRPELLRSEITAETTPLGDNIDMAIQPDSELRQVLREYSPDTSVVVIAVYPDSIRELHVLKRELYAAGYAIAEVPCLAGKPIGISHYAAPRSAETFAQ